MNAGLPMQATTDGTRQKRRAWRSLRAQAALIFVLLALVPALVVGVLLVDVNRAAVETSERQLQAAVLAEVTATVERVTDRARDELSAIASALVSEAQKGDAQDADPGPSFVGVSAVLAAGRQVRAVRFEVPSAGVDTELRVATDETPLPRLSAASRALAPARGVVFVRSPTGPVSLLTRISIGEGNANGYLSTTLEPNALRRELVATLQSRFGGSHVRVLVIDAQRRAIVSNLADAPAEERAGSVDLWKLLPDPRTWSTHFALVGAHREDDVAMLGAVETIPSLGWAVALWRPEKEAYATLEAMKLRAAGVAALSVVLGLGLALVTAGRLTSPLLAMAAKARAIGARAWTSLEPLPSIPNELGELGRSLDSMVDQLQASELEIARQARLRSELGRFMNPMLVERILRGEHSLALGGARTTVSVLFADVVGFTPLAEKAPPETVVGLLNELFALLTEVVERNDGIVDKFAGDSVMALFGAPEPSAQHARQALSAAEEMLHFVRLSNEDWLARYGVRIRLGIGISSGECTLGNLGSDKRMEYTAIGDVVNVAARLEALAAPDQVLLTDSTRQAAGEGFEFVAIGEQSLAGREAKVSVFALGGG